MLGGPAIGTTQSPVATSAPRPGGGGAKKKAKALARKALSAAARADYERVGGAVGNFIGGKQGRRLGTVVGKAANMIMGRGDYEVKYNSLLPGASSIPLFGVGKRWVRLEHKEFLFNVTATGSTSWAIQQSINLNPGMPGSFPWISAIASNFDEYIIGGLVFIYESTSGSLSTTQGLGSVTISTQYDPGDPVFATELEMLESEWSSSAGPNVSFSHYLECNPDDTVMPKKFVRMGGVGTNPLALYDMGTTSVSVSGCSATAGTALGKIWVSYDIYLGKPKLYGGMLARSTLFANVQLNAGVTNGTMFNGAALSTGSTLAVTFNTTTQLSFPKWVSTGTYAIVLKVVGSSTAIAYPTPSLTNAVALPGTTTFPYSSITAYVGANPNPTSTVLQAVYFINVTAAGAIVDFSGGTFPSSVTSGNVLVTQMAYNFS